MTNKDREALRKHKFGFVRGRDTQKLINRLNDNVEQFSNYNWYRFVYQFRKTPVYEMYDEPDKVLSVLCRQPANILHTEKRYNCELPHLKALMAFLVDDDKEYNEFINTAGLPLLEQVLTEEFGKLGLRLIKKYTLDELTRINNSKKKQKEHATPSSPPDAPFFALTPHAHTHDTPDTHTPDTHTPDTNTHPVPSPPTWTWTAREYQLTIIKEGIRVLTQSKKYYLNLATGGGKSFIVYNILKHIRPSTVIVFSPRKKINSQNTKEKYLSILHDSHTYKTLNTSTDPNWATWMTCGNQPPQQQQHNPAAKLFVVCCTQSISKMHNVLLQSGATDVVVWFDEAHWSIEKGAEEVDNHAKQFFLTNQTQIGHRIFTSASPDVKRVAQFPGIFGSLHTPISVKQLIDQKWLCPIRPRVLEYKTNDNVNLSAWILQECNTLQRSFTFSFHSSENNAFQLFHQHYQRYTQHLTTNKPFLLIDTKGFSDANRICYKSVVLDYDYKCDETFEASPQSIAYVCRKYDMGYDFPKLDCVVFSDPKVSHTDIIQCIGRGTRSDCEGEGCTNQHKHLDVLLPVFIDLENVDDNPYMNIVEVLRYLILALDLDITDILSKRKTEPHCGNGQSANTADYDGNENRSKLLDLLYQPNFLERPTTKILIRFCKTHCITDESGYNRFKKQYPEIPLKRNLFDYEQFRWNLILDPKQDIYYTSLDEVKRAQKTVLQSITNAKERKRLRSSVRRTGWMTYHEYDNKIPPMRNGEVGTYF